MKFRIILILMVLALSFSLFSCITSREINVEISCDQFGETPNFASEFTASVGDKITVKLCSNQSTGFRWEYETTGDAVLQEEDHDLVEPEGGVVGAPGQEVWTFEAVEKGTTEVHMEYNRPEEGTEQPEWTYTITITVE